MAKSQAARFFHSLYRTRSSGDVDRESFGPGRRPGPRCHDIGVWDPLHVWQEWGPWKRFRVLLVDGLEERKPLSLHDTLVRQHPLQVRQGRLRVTVPPAPPRFPPAFNTAPVRRALGAQVAAAAGVEAPLVAEVAASLSGGALRAAARRFLLEATRSWPLAANRSWPSLLGGD